MKKSLIAAVMAVALLLAGYVTAKAGWLIAKAPEKAVVMKTMPIRTAEQFNAVMSTEAAKAYRLGQGSYWKYAMVYR